MGFQGSGLGLGFLNPKPSRVYGLSGFRVLGLETLNSSFKTIQRSLSRQDCQLDGVEELRAFEANMPLKGSFKDSSKGPIRDL